MLISENSLRKMCPGQKDEYVHTWIIEGLDLRVGYPNPLPSQHIFKFSLCGDMRFEGSLKLIYGSMNDGKILIFNIKCTTHRNWKVICKSADLGEEWVFTQNKPEHKRVFKELNVWIKHCNNYLHNAAIKLTLLHITDVPPIRENEIKRDILQLFETKKFCDITFKVGNKEIHAHKCIVANRSPVFEAMFQHETKENLTNTVEIEDINLIVFEEMLRYIYTNDVTNLKTMAAELLAASEKYDLPTLKSICEKELGDNLAVDNAVQILILADLYRAEELKKKSINFITKNGKSVRKTKVFKEMVINHPNLVAELLSEALRLL